MSLYFVADDAGELYLVMSLDPARRPPGETAEAGGHVTVTMTLTASDLAAQRVRIDQLRGGREIDCTLVDGSRGPCLWDGGGTLRDVKLRWEEEAGDALVLGGLSVEGGFQMRLTFTAVRGITEFNVATYDEGQSSLDVMSVSSEDALRHGIVVMAGNQRKLCRRPLLRSTLPSLVEVRCAPAAALGITMAHGADRVSWRRHSHSAMTARVRLKLEVMANAWRRCAGLMPLAPTTGPRSPIQRAFETRASTHRHFARRSSTFEATQTAARYVQTPA